MTSRPYVPGKYFTGIPCKNGHISDRLKYNGQCIECKRDTDRKSNLKAGKRYRIRALYDLTIDEVSCMNQVQNNKCAICSMEFPEVYKIQIDHCHVTGKVRGLLCLDCNWMLGKAKDNVQTLRNAVKYLEKHK